MYDIAMSSNTAGREDRNQDATIMGPVADVGYLTDVSDFDFDDSDKGGLGSFLLKGGAFCLIAAMIFTSYQFIPRGETKEKSFQSTSLHDWEKKSNEVDEDTNFKVSVERRFAEKKSIDFMTTASTEISDLIQKNQARVIQTEEKVSKHVKVERPAAKGKMYIVQAGDTLSKIAQMFKTSSNTIIAMNEIKNPSLITPGMRLVVSK